MEEQAGKFSLGKSIIVPSVQELAKVITDVPTRYVRLDQETSLVGYGLSTSSVPVIDLQKLLDVDQGNSELQRLDAACKEWGFFQIINHGISNAMLDQLRTQVENFFRLPYEEKKKLWQTPENYEGLGQIFVVSEDQKLEWSDVFLVNTLPPERKNSDLYAKIPQKLRETMEAYCSEQKQLAIKLLSNLAKALNMDARDFEDTFGDGMQAMRFNYYPPCPEPEKVIGFTSHSDTSGLTILLQLDDTDGLQIRKDGKWVPVKPLPNAFIVNVGDVLEIFSNGVYKSIEHRATVNSIKERVSVTTFYCSNLKSELGPAPSLVGPQNPAIFRTVPTEKYFKEFFANKLIGKSYLEYMRMDEHKSDNM